jgi:hypothetical protein
MNQTAQPAPASPAQTSNQAPWKLIASAAGAAVAVVIAVVAIVMLTDSSGVAATDITVQEVVNRVEADRPPEPAADTTNFVPVVLGQDLTPGHSPKTYEASETRVDIAVGDFIRVTRTKPNTLWRLGQFVLEEDTIIELEQGRIFLFDDGDELNPKPI